MQFSFFSQKETELKVRRLQKIYNLYHLLISPLRSGEIANKQTVGYLHNTPTFALGTLSVIFLRSIDFLCCVL